MIVVKWGPYLVPSILGSLLGQDFHLVVAIIQLLVSGVPVHLASVMLSVVFNSQFTNEIVVEFRKILYGGWVPSKHPVALSYFFLISIYKAVFF